MAPIRASHEKQKETPKVAARNKRSRAGFQKQDHAASSGASSSTAASSSAGALPANEVTTNIAAANFFGWKLETKGPAVGLDDLKESTNRLMDMIGGLTEEVLKLRKEGEERALEISRKSKLLPKEPFADLENFFVFEKCIKVRENLAFAINELSHLNATDAEAFILKCWRTVMTDELASYFTWLGIDKKFSANKLYLTVAIDSAFKRKFPEDDFSKMEVETRKFFASAALVPLRSSLTFQQENRGEKL